MNRLYGWLICLLVARVTSSGAGLEYPTAGLSSSVVDDLGAKYVVRDQGMSFSVGRGGSFGGRGGASVAKAVTNAPTSFFVAKYDSQSRTNNRLWFHDAPNLRASALAAYGTNWIVVAGRAMGETRLGTVAIYPWPTNRPEIFVTRIAPDGRFDWVRHFQGSGLGSVTSVAVDQAGNIVFTGELRSGNVDFDGTILSTIRTNSGCDGYVVKLDPDGKLVWARRDGGDFIEPRGIATARDGSIYVTGSFFGKFADRQAEKPGADTYLAKYRPDGERQWVTSPGGPPSRHGYSVATDVEGNPYVVGLLGADRRFGSLTVTQDMGNYANAFLAKYNPEAELQWVRQFHRQDSSLGKVTALASATVLETKSSTTTGPGHIANLEAAIKASAAIRATGSTFSDDASSSSVPGEVPKLTIFKQGGQFLIVWPGRKGEFVLESTDSIQPLALWTPVSSEQTSGDSLVMAVVTGQSAAKFYRLRR